MYKAGKIWGSTTNIEANNSFEVHRIKINTGGTCSEHKHTSKWNGFYVEEGVLLIRVWQENGLIDETTLLSGDYAKVAPGLYHQFECLAKAVAFEFYWSELQHDDIERKTKGFIKS